MKKRTIVALCSCFLSQFAWSQTTTTSTQTYIGDNAVKKFVSTTGFQSAGLGVLIKDVETGATIAEYQSATNRIPASVTKLITTATAMEMLKDTFRFKTRVCYSGTIEDSVLHGNLYIVGGGDPSFESDYFQHTPVFDQMQASVENAGIKKIDGDIVGDASLFQRSGANGTWLMEDIGSYYGQTPTALCFHDNLFMVTCKGDDSTGVGVIENVLPHNNLLKIDNRILSGSQTWWHIYGDTYDWTKIVRGRVPSTSKTLIKMEMPDPALLVADSLRAILANSGISSNGVHSTIWTNERAPLENTIYTHYSPRLVDIEKQTNYHSINLFAENLFLYLGVKGNEPTNYDVAASALRKHWNNRGVSTATTFQVDGSGLSMKNSISPEFLTNVLIYMKKKSTYGNAFVSTLPTAAKNGTVKGFLLGTVLAGKAFVKSGSMDRVQNYSGYILWNKKWYAFTVMVNNFTCPRKQVKTAIGTLLADTFKAIGGPDAVVKKTAASKAATAKKTK